MLSELNIKDADWHQTPPAVRNILRSQSHQLRLLRIRCAAYAQRVRDLETKIARTTELEATVAQQQKVMEAVTARLNEQASQIQRVSVQLEVTKRASQMVVNNQ